jgi:hypothetical protein
MSVSSSATGRSFLRSFAVASFTALALWIGIVLAFDPYLAFGTRVVPKSVILPTSRMLGDEQLIKDHLFSQKRPDTVIIGSSRAAYGLDPASPALAGISTYNLAMLGATLADLEGLAAQARQNRHHVRRVILGLDHYMFFQPDHDGAPDIRQQRMEEARGPVPIPLRHIQAFLLSTKPMKVIEGILDNARRNDTLGEADANGLIHRTYRYRIADRSRTFEASIKLVFDQKWYARPDEALISQRLRRLAGMIRSTCEAGIKVDILLSPEHVMLYEVAALTGQGVRREQLRRDMARMVALVAADTPNCLRYRDASGLSAAALEGFRLASDSQPLFIEPLHYATVLGERLLLGFAKPDDPQSLGIDPFRGGLETDILNSRRLLEEWQQSSPEDMALVRRMHEAEKPRV